MNFILKDLNIKKNLHLNINLNNIIMKIFYNKYCINLVFKTLVKIFIYIIIFFNDNLLALGLSDIKVNSYLNEPLNATIKITGAEDLNPVSLLVDLADSKDFMRAGIPRPVLLSYLKFEIKKLKEEITVQVYTNIVIKDPFLDFLLRLTWPDGTIIKNYTVLLDLKPIEQKNFFPDSNVDQTTNVNKEVNTKVTNIHHTDTIFSTPLDQVKEYSTKQQLEKITHIETNPTTNTNDSNIENLNDLNKYNNEEVSSLLNKLIVNLQNISEVPKKRKINYQKLLDLNPEVISLSKEEEKLAEKFAITQIDSELNALRGEKSKKETSNINTNTMHSITTSENINNLKNNNNNNNSSYNKQHNLYYYNAHSNHPYNQDFFYKYDSNNLLLAFFLVSGTMYWFYRLISTTQSTTQTNMPKEVNNKQPKDLLVAPVVDDMQYENGSMHNDKLLNENLELAVSFNDKNKNINTNNNNNNTITKNNTNTIHFIRNEELELKMDLATQYMATGDKKSAKELLQDIIHVKDQKYKDQVNSMLKILD